MFAMNVVESGGLPPTCAAAVAWSQYYVKSSPTAETKFQPSKAATKLTMMPSMTKPPNRRHRLASGVPSGAVGPEGAYPPGYWPYCCWP